MVGAKSWVRRLRGGFVLGAHAGKACCARGLRFGRARRKGVLREAAALGEAQYCGGGRSRQRFKWVRAPAGAKSWVRYLMESVPPGDLGWCVFVFDGSKVTRPAQGTHLLQVLLEAHQHVARRP